MKRNLANLVNFGGNLADLGRNLAKFGGKSARFGESWRNGTLASEFGLLWSILA